MNTDHQLLDDYRVHGTDDTFAILVKRYVDLVYSAALRQVHDPAMAQDVTQAVFIILSRKGRRLSPNTLIAGWLVRTTRFASLRALRSEYRRRQTEQKAFEMNDQPAAGDDATWQQISPLLDAAVAKLGDKDRSAVILRFFENKSFAEVAEGIGATEDAAKKRVARALERLRAMFAARKIPLATTSVAALLSNEAVQSAPPELAAQLITHTSAAAATPAVSLLVKETIRAMLWMKIQVAATVAAVVLLAAGTLGMAVLTANESRPKTPKDTLRYLAKTFSEGDGARFTKAIHLTIDESPELATPWLPALEKLVKAQANFRKAAIERFGADTVTAAMPFWKSLDDLVRELTQVQERVDGAQAKFPITMFGRTFPDVPLLLQTNGLWKLPIDLRFKSGAKINGPNNNNFAMSFQRNGLHISLSSRGELDTQKALQHLTAWSDLLNRTASDLRAGKFASPTEAWNLCTRNFDALGLHN